MGIDTAAATAADTDLDMDKVVAFAEQVGGVLGAAATTAMVRIGDALGLYPALARSGPVTAAQLATATETQERYLLEWLSQQATAGFLTYDADAGTFALPAEHAAVLATDDSPASLVSAAELITGMYRGLDPVLETFRSGQGIPWGEQDRAVIYSCERFFKVGYQTSLVSEWIPAMDGVQERLRAGARVASVGCGHGAALILLARAFPGSRFVGYDVHAGSIEVARKNGPPTPASATGSDSRSSPMSSTRPTATT